MQGALTVVAIERGSFQEMRAIVLGEHERFFGAHLTQALQVALVPNDEELAVTTLYRITELIAINYRNGRSGELKNLGDPLNDTLECLTSRNVVKDHRAVRAAIIEACERLIAFLTR